MLLAQKNMVLVLPKIEKKKLSLYKMHVWKTSSINDGARTIKEVLKFMHIDLFHQMNTLFHDQNGYEIEIKTKRFMFSKKRLSKYY